MINKEIMIDGRKEINKTFNLILFGMPILVWKKRIPIMIENINVIVRNDSFNFFNSLVSFNIIFYLY